MALETLCFIPAIGRYTMYSMQCLNDPHWMARVLHSIVLLMSLFNSSLCPEVSQHISLAAGVWPMARLKPGTGSSCGLNETGQRFALALLSRGQLWSFLLGSGRKRQMKGPVPRSALHVPIKGIQMGKAWASTRTRPTSASASLQCCIGPLWSSCFFAHPPKLSYGKCLKSWPDWATCRP